MLERRKNPSNWLNIYNLLSFIQLVLLCSRRLILPDESWISKSGSLKTEINRVGADVINVNRFNMVYPHDLPAPDPWHEKIVYKVHKKSPYYSLNDPFKDPIPEPYFYWNLPGKVLCRTKNLIRITQGNHCALYEKEVSETTSEDISIYHFPFRSHERFIRSTISIGEGYSNKVIQQKDIGHMGWHRRRWYNMLLSGQSQSVLREVVPSKTMLDRDIKQGKVIIDEKIHKSLDDLSTRMQNRGR